MSLPLFLHNQSARKLAVFIHFHDLLLYMYKHRLCPLCGTSLIL